MARTSRLTGLGQPKRLICQCRSRCRADADLSIDGRPREERRVHPALVGIALFPLPCCATENPLRGNATPARACSPQCPPTHDRQGTTAELYYKRSDLISRRFANVLVNQIEQCKRRNALPRSRFLVLGWMTAREIILDLGDAGQDLGGHGVAMAGGDEGAIAFQRPVRQDFHQPSRLKIILHLTAQEAAYTMPLHGQLPDRAGVVGGDAGTEAQLRALPGAIGQGEIDHGIRTMRGEEQHLMLKQILGTADGGPGLQVIGGRAQHGAHAGQRDIAGAGSLAYPQGQVDAVIHEIDVVIADVDADAQLGMAADEMVEGGHQVFGGHEAGGGDAQFADQFLVQALGGIARFIGQRDDARAVGIEALAGFGEAELAGGPVQQGGTEDGFERTDVLADRRRGQPQFASGLGKGSQLDDAGEDHHAGQVIHGLVFHRGMQEVDGSASTIARDVV